MHKIGFLLTDGFQLMALSTQSVFEFANRVAGAALYDFACFSEEGGRVHSSSGLVIDTWPIAEARRIDSWLVPGVLEPQPGSTPPTTRDMLLRAVRRSRRVVGLCTGAFVLADAGLLDGRRATTHWGHAKALQTAHPEVQVESDRIFIVDDGVWTSAGMSAAYDLALAMVEKDLGADVARSVARNLVMPQWRAGGQTQHSELLEMSPRSDRIQSALAYAKAHIKNALTVEELAEVAALSPRQFSRVFTAETGVSPAKAVEGLRPEAARLMIEQSRHSLEVVARETGFRDRRHLREVYVRRLGVSPQLTRRQARGSA